MWTETKTEEKLFTGMVIQPYVDEDVPRWMAYNLSPLTADCLHTVTTMFLSQKNLRDMTRLDLL